MHKALTLIVALVVAATLLSCDKAPDGVIKEGDMAHVIAEFAKAEAMIEENPSQFPDDSSKLALKQSILKKYDADLAMYDSSLVWYAHNLKIYSQVHDKAIEILEKETNKDGTHVQSTNPNIAINNQGARRIFPSSGDSANVWKEPQQWILTSAMRDGIIPFDYKPEKEGRKGDKYTLCFKMINSGNSITMLLAIDYRDGSTSYINRSAQDNGWIENAIQSDSSKVIKRIYGFIKYKTRPQGVTFIDSTYMLRTRLDKSQYHTFYQRTIGTKNSSNSSSAVVEEKTEPNTSYPGRPQSNAPSSYPGRPAAPEQGSFKPKPGLNKSSEPRRQRIPNPNGDHVPHPPIR